MKDLLKLQVVNSGLALKNRTLLNRSRYLKSWLRFHLGTLIFPYFCTVCNRYIFFISHFKKHSDYLDEYRHLVRTTNYEEREIQRILLNEVRK
jgi:hypothetical protein